MKKAEEKLHELIYDALTNEDEGEVYTITVEQLKQRAEALADDELNKFAQQAAEELNPENDQ